MSGVKDSEAQCEFVPLYPVRYALANRLGGEQFPPYWTAPLKAGLPDIDHWGYACRTLRFHPEGNHAWVYLYYNNKLHEYEYRSTGLLFLNAVYDAGGQPAENTPSVGYCAIFVPKNTTGEITYSENQWNSTRVKQIAGDAALRKKRMQPFTTAGGIDHMASISLVEEVVEEMREVPNGLVCMGVELSLNAAYDYGPVCYHGIENAGKLKITPHPYLKMTTLTRAQALSKEQYSRHCCAGVLTPAENAPPHHISWHGSKEVAPFVSFRKKSDAGQSILHGLGVEIKDLPSCGQIIALYDPIGICRELTALYNLANDDEKLYHESIAYLKGISDIIDAVQTNPTLGKYIISATREDARRAFKESNIKVEKGITAYYDDIVKTKAEWIRLKPCPEDLFLEVIRDLTTDSTPDLIGREETLAAILPGFTRTDAALPLAEELFITSPEAKSPLWECVFPKRSAPFPVTKGTPAVAASLWRLFLPGDEKAELRIATQLKWFEALKDREILNMVPANLSAWEVYILDSMINSIFPLEQASAAPNPGMGDPLYLTEEQAEEIRQATASLGGRRNFPLASPNHHALPKVPIGGLPRSIPAVESKLTRKSLRYIPPNDEKFPESLKTDPTRYTLYMPDVLYTAVAGSSAQIAGEAWFAMKDLVKDPIVPTFRMAVTLIAGYALAQVIADKGATPMDRAGPIVGAAGAIFGLGEWGAALGGFSDTIIRGLGAASKGLAGMACLILAAGSAGRAFEALGQGQYAKALQNALHATAFTSISASFIVKGLQDLAEINRIPWIATWAERVLGYVPRFFRTLAARNPYVIGLFLAAEILGLITGDWTGFNLGEWSGKCVWSVAASQRMVFSLSPVVAREAIPGHDKDFLANAWREEERDLFRTLYEPKITHKSTDGHFVRLEAMLPGFMDTTSKFWLQWGVTYWRGGRESEELPLRASGVAQIGEKEMSESKRTLEIVFPCPEDCEDYEDRPDVNVRLNWGYYVGVHPLFAMLAPKDTLLTGKVRW